MSIQMWEGGGAIAQSAQEEPNLPHPDTFSPQTLATHIEKMSWCSFRSRCAQGRSFTSFVSNGPLMSGYLMMLSAGTALARNADPQGLGRINVTKDTP